MYKEISRREEKIIRTLVEFTFNINGEEIKKEVDIPHFCPKDEKEIELGISNRFVSEERDLKELNLNPEVILEEI